MMISLVMNPKSASKLTRRWFAMPSSCQVACSSNCYSMCWQQYMHMSNKNGCIHTAVDRRTPLAANRCILGIMYSIHWRKPTALLLQRKHNCQTASGLAPMYVASYLSQVSYILAGCADMSPPGIMLQSHSLALPVWMALAPTAA